MAVYVPSVSKFEARGFTQIVPGTFARELPDGSSITLRLDGDSILLAAATPAGEPVPPSARFYLSTFSQFTGLLNMLRVPA